mgnify:CR=1 FL=1
MRNSQRRASLKVSMNAGSGTETLILGLLTSWTRKSRFRHGVLKRLLDFSNFTKDSSHIGARFRGLCLEGILSKNLRTQSSMKNKFYGTIRNLVRAILKWRRSKEVRKFYDISTSRLRKMYNGKECKSLIIQNFHQ